MSAVPTSDYLDAMTPLSGAPLAAQVPPGERLKRQCAAIEATGQRPPQLVVCAAMRNRAGKIVCGARHYDAIMREQVKHERAAWLGCEQGFIDQYGTFLTREEALRIAREQGQIRARCGGDERQLYSENLY